MIAMFNPCTNGHVFVWTSTTTTVESAPPDGTVCECGLMRYRQEPERLHENIDLWTWLVPVQPVVADSQASV